MHSVAICGFHHHIIRFLCQFGIFNQRLIFVANVSRKNNLFLYARLFQPHFDTGRPQQVPDIRKPYLNAVTQMNYRVIMARHNAVYYAIRILHRVNRLFYFHLRMPLCLPVPPLRFLHLDMSTVTQHNTAQIRTCIRHQYPAPESLCIQKGKHT